MKTNKKINYMYYDSIKGKKKNNNNIPSMNISVKQTVCKVLNTCQHGKYLVAQGELILLSLLGLLLNEAETIFENVGGA